MEVVLIGMGPGPGCLTLQAQQALEGADCLIGSRRLLEECPLPGEVHRFPSTRPGEMVEHLRRHAFRAPCVLFSGDTGFHSGAAPLLPLLKEAGFTWRLIPGVSSPQYLAALLGRSWQDWSLVSAHAAPVDPVGAVLEAQGRPVCFLTSGKAGAGALCALLAKAGLGHLKATVGESLGYPEEHVEEFTVSQLAGEERSPLTVLLVEGYRPPRPLRAPGLEDEVFLRGEVPMTKQEVRAAALAKLAPAPRGVYWDVGAGTGSVAVELALLSPGGQVWAVERGAEGCQLIRANRERFGAYNLRLVQGTAPLALQELPAPDGVFVGGSGGELEAILQCAIAKNPAARLCVTAIAPETLAAAITAMKELGLTPQVTQITAARSRKAGALHLMMGQNPVWIITGGGKETP